MFELFELKAPKVVNSVYLSHEENAYYIPVNIF